MGKIRKSRNPGFSIKDGIHDAHSRIAEHYGSMDYHGQVPLNTYEHWNHQRHVLEPLKRVLRHAQLTENSVILDAGCGNGQFAQLYAGLTPARIVGVDFSRAMLEAAVKRSTVGKYAQRFDAVRQPLENLSCFERGTFDLVHCVGVIEHLDDPHQVIAELVRVAKSDGILVLLIPRKYSLSWLTYLIWGQSPHLWGTPRNLREKLDPRSRMKYYRFYSSHQIEVFFADRRIEQIEVIPVAYGFLIGPLRRLLDKFGEQGPRGYRHLDHFQNTIKRFYPIPAGEYYVLRKKLQA